MELLKSGVQPQKEAGIQQKEPVIYLPDRPITSYVEGESGALYQSVLIFDEESGNLIDHLIG